MSFESVKKSGPIWECKQTGSKKENNITPLEPGDTSWIIGYYLGSEEVDNTNGNGKSTVHKIKMTKVGDEKHILGERDDSNEISIWGTGVLDDQMSRVGIGQLCKVVWEGKVAPKKGTNHYHTWDVLVDRTAEPYAPDTNIGNTTAAPVAEPEQASPAAAPAVTSEGDDDDDLPF